MKILILTLVSTYTLTDAFPGFIIPETELIYDYHATVQVGTREPTSQASQFTLSGHLHLQPDAKSTIARLSDLKYTLYNGKINKHDEHILNVLPFPTESQDIMNPFRIVYNDDGKVQHITTQSNEHEYARNMKRAIASVLQIDLKKLKLESELPYAFVTEENSIYGKSKVNYNVMPQENNIVIQKMQDVMSSTKWYNYYGINASPIYDKNIFKNPLSMDNQKIYTLVKSVKGIYIKDIKAHGGTYINPYNSIAQSFYMTVKQTFTLKDKKKDIIKHTIHGNEEINELNFHLDNETKSDSVSDLSLGRHPLKMENFIRQANEILEDAILYSEQNHLTTKRPDFKQAQAMNRLHRIMSLFDVPALQQLYNTLHEKTGKRNEMKFKYLQNIIPLIGTRATTIFIQNLIRNKKVNDELAINMLSKMALNIRMTSEKLLIEIKDLISLRSDMSFPLRKAAILSFSTLIHKTYEKSHDLYNNPELNKYILKFIEQIKSTDDYDMQYLYLIALYNIKLGNVARYLEPLIKGEVPNMSRHVQYLAMCASFAEHVKDPEKTDEIYWPILTNRTLHLELRVGAYIIITAANQNMATLLNVHRYMETEPCQEFYNFFFTHMQSLAETTNPMLKAQKTMAAQILRIMRKPYKHQISRYHLMDYVDPKYGFGGMTNYMMTSTDTSKTIYIELSSQVLDVQFINYAIWIKIDNHFPLDKNDFTIFDGHNFERLMSQIESSILYEEDFHMEVGILKHDQVISIEYFNHTNVENVVRFLDSYLPGTEIKTSYKDVTYILTEIILPNDLGFPTFIQIKVPLELDYKRHTTSEQSHNHQTEKVTEEEIMLKLSLQSAYDMSFYNPIPDVWQGIQQMNSIDYSMYLDVNLKPLTRGVNIKVKRNENQNLFGSRSYTTSVTYIFGVDEDLLKTSNSKSNKWMEVMKDPMQNDTFSLLSYHCENTGLNYQVKVFNSEREFTHRELRQNINKLLQDQSKNYLESLYLSLSNILARILIMPGVGSCGFLMTVFPSDQQSVGHTDINFEVSTELKPHKDFKELKSKKLNIRFTYSMRNKADENMKTWHMNAILNMDPTSSNMNLKAQITRTIPDNTDWSLCIEGEKKWLADSVIGNLVIAMENTTDYKCLKNDVLIEINMKGEKSDEQNADIVKSKNGIYVYPDDCEYIYDPNLPTIPKVECLTKFTTYRKYNYDVKMTKVPSHLKTIFNNIWNYHQDRLLPYVMSPELIKEEETMKIEIEFPMTKNIMTINIVDKCHNYDLTARPWPGLSIFGLYPDSYYIPQLFQYFNSICLTNSIIFHQEMINDLKKNGHVNKVDPEIPILTKKWGINCEGEKETLCQFVLMLHAKELNKSNLRTGHKQLALRITTNTSNIEYNDGQLIQDGTLINTDSYQHHSWFSSGLLPDRTLLLYLHKLNAYVDSNDHYVRVFFIVP